MTGGSFNDRQAGRIGVSPAGLLLMLEALASASWLNVF